MIRRMKTRRENARVPDASAQAVLQDVLAALRELDGSPQTRELRGKATSYENTVNRWATVPPSEAQQWAMEDLLRELYAKVLAARTPTVTRPSIPLPGLRKR